MELIVQQRKGITGGVILILQITGVFVLFTGVVQATPATATEAISSSP